MLRFRCDCCGGQILNAADVVQIRLIPYAYVPDADPLYKLPMVGELCRRCSDEMEDFLLKRQEDMSKGREIAEACAGDVMPGEAVPVPRNPLGEGRCLTLARARVNMRQWELGEKMHAEQAVVSLWERSKVEPDWGALEKLLPELAEIRKRGCAAYCAHKTACDKRGECYYARYRVGE